MTATASDRRRTATVADPPAHASPTASDIQPRRKEGLHRILTASVTPAPIAFLIVAIRQAWNHDLHWYDLVVFALTDIPIGLGVTIGFHRHLRHPSFKTSPFPARPARGPRIGGNRRAGISWVADHRKHHAFSDRPGDPHSPHVDHGLGWRGELRGLAHAHVGWLFLHAQRAATERYASALLADPVIRFVNATSLLWVLLGLAVPFELGVAIGGTVTAGLTGLLWGGGVRVLVLHRVTTTSTRYATTTRHPFQTGDHSRNLAWLSLASLGEAWHNNHHAFPTSAFHRLHRHELDPSALAIRLLERTGLVWDVVRISPERQAGRALAS